VTRCIENAVRLRRELHRYPELSGSESNTAKRIARFFQPLRPDLVIRGLGGHGIAFVFAGSERGPTVMLRAELDALPIQQRHGVTNGSTADGMSHACGHDGHMAILAAVGEAVGAARPRRGRVVFLYQPSEEDGDGAAAVISDEKFREIEPDFVFALHNLPGLPLGEVAIRAGPFCCASRGMVVSLEGRTAHAAQPETGVSPTGAFCRIVELLEDLPARLNLRGKVAFATVVGARLGKETAFGTTPGEARVSATLRSESDGILDRMAEQTSEVVRGIAEDRGLSVGISWRDGFSATVNSAEAVEVVLRAADEQQVRLMVRPYRWSEDFGRFTKRYKGAIFGLGAGEHVPDLHNSAYSFPDDLIPIGTGLFVNIIRECLG